MSNPWEVESVSDASEWEVAEQWEVETEEPESGVGAAFGAGVDKLQETAYRAVKGFTDTGENPEDYEKGSVGRAVAETVGQGGSLSQWAQDGIDRNVEEQKSYEPTVKSYKDIYDEDSPVLGTASNLASYTGELVSNSAPYMLAAAHPASAFAMGGGLSEEAYSKQPEGEKNAARAVASGMGQMALERLGLKGSTGAIFDTVKKEGLRNTVKRIRKGEFAEVYKRPDSALEFSRRVLFGAAAEGSTEAGQEALAQWGAGKDLSQIDYSNMDENFFGGFAAGGAIRTGSEAFQVASAWKDKAQPIAKNGIESLVEAGTPMDEAIEQVRDQLIESAKKQGLSEVAAEASAARILKEEYDIDHEVFTPVADDVASRRAAMNERLHQQRVEGGFGDVQDALSTGETAPTVDSLLNEAQNFNDPFASELEQQQAFEHNQNLKEYQQSITDEVNSQPLAIEDKGIIFAQDNSHLFDDEKITQQEEAEKQVETKGKVADLGIVEAPVNELSLSDDVPQFKDGANNEGVVEPLGGKFDRTGVAPIQVWVRNNGKKEVISGRHRLDLAKRSGEKSIPAQYHYESEGFTKQKASAMDAILNIREGQGKVKDYVEFIKAAGLSKEEADAQGILARATGKRAYSIANFGSDSLIASHRNERLSDEAANQIAVAAPNNEALQAVGIKAIEEGKPVGVAINMVKAVGQMTQGQQQDGDLFGFDDSALVEAENLAKAASKKQAKIQKTLSAVTGAAKNPELAAKEGVDINDKDALQNRIADLKHQKFEWQNWHTNPNLVSELKGEQDLTLTQETESQRQEREAQEAKTQKQQAKTQKQQAEVEAKAGQKEKADKETENFLLTGSDGEADIAMANGQGDLLSSPPPKQETKTEPTTASKEAVSVSEPEETKTHIVDAKAHEAATSPLNDTPEPTQAQKEANNYKLGRIKHSGFDIGIENPQGSDRKGTDSNGKEWSVTMNHHYGDLTGTKGADGDAIDVFVKPSTENGNKVFVVDQVEPKSGKFDEHKVMLGFDTLAEAKEAYLSNYSKGWKGLGSISEVSLDNFKAWTKDGDTSKAFKSDMVEAKNSNGQKVKGIVDNTLTREQAKAIDPQAFRKGKDGWFIRQEMMDKHTKKRPQSFSKTKYFRGQPKNKPLRLNENGLLWVTPEKNYAEDSHYGGKEGAEVIQLEVDESNIFDFEKVENKDLLLTKGKSPTFRSAINGNFRGLQDPEIIKALKELGFEGFKALEPEGQKSIALFNVDKVRQVSKSEPKTVKVSNNGVDVTIPLVSKELVDGYNRSTHLGRGRDLNKEQEDTVINLIDELAESKHVLDTAEQKSEASRLISDYIADVAEFNRWNANQSINNPSWIVTGRSGRNMAKANAKSERTMNEYVKRVDALEATRKRIKQRLYDLRPDDLKAKQKKNKELGTIAEYVGIVAADVKDGKNALAKDSRKWAIPKALKALENSLNLDRQATIDYLKEMDSTLSDIGGLAKVAGPRSKFSKLFSELVQSSDTKQEPEQGDYSYSRYEDFIKSFQEQTLTIEQVKTSFDDVVANKDKIIAELNSRKFTKPMLQKMVRTAYSDTPKAKLADMAYQRMLSSHVLGDVVSTVVGGGKTYEQQIADKVDSQTQADLDSEYQRISKIREGMKKRRDQQVKAVTNPETLEEFKEFIRVRGKDNLTVEQLAKYDDLAADSMKEKVKPEVVEAEAVDVETERAQTKHSKTGADLFVVKMLGRVDRDKFKDLSSKAKQLGGYYSSYAKSGAIPGFQFKTNEAADNFEALLKGESVNKAESIEAKQEDKQAKNSERLNALADKLEEKANSDLNAPRLTNTAKRASQAAYASNEAYKQLALAETLKNIASKLKDGGLKHLENISQKTQLENLLSIQKAAIPHDLMTGDYDGYRLDYALKKGVTVDDYIKNVKYPSIFIHADKAQEVSEKLKGKRGFARLATELTKLPRYPQNNRNDLKQLSPEQAKLIIKASKEKVADVYLGWIPDNLAQVTRLQAMGINTIEQLRAAIRELDSLTAVKKKEDPVKKLERDLVGKKIEGYFPTPKELVNKMLDYAQIEAGQSVLEPSAGKGNIADLVKESAPDAKLDVVEYNSTLNNILKAKGHNVVGNDFLDVTKEYDRIVMNPPFENFQDIDHVRHAYDLLKPDGKLVAIMGAGVKNSRKKAVEFREWVESKGSYIEDLPSGSFKNSERATGVETVMVVLDKQEDVAFSIDAPSTVKGTGKEKGMHIDAATKIAQEFMDEYNGGIKIDIRVAENQEDHYGQENTSDKVGVIQGAFHRRGRYVSIVASNLHSTADAREVLRHEILGHYGLEVLGSEAKADIINQIIESKNERSLSKYWKDVQNNDYYKTLPIEAQAEEVFAHVIQSGRGKYQKMYDAIITWLRGALKKVGLAKYPATTSELHRLADTIAKKIKEGAEPDLSYLQPSTGTSFSRKSNSIHIADESKIDSGIRKIQDKFRRLKLVQRELNNVNESNDTYLAEEAFHGKVSEDLRQMEVEHVDKIANLMAQYELSQDEVDLYLIAKHAEERNAYIDSINPELEGKGSGMSNEDAQRILDKAIIEGKRLKLENVADHVYAMLAETRQRMVDAGLEPQDAIDTWQEQYQYYVPLKGYAADDAKVNEKGKSYKSGKGFNVKGRETIKALGRKSLAESPLLHTISDTTSSIIRARKNEVGNTFLKMVNDNPDNEFWQVFTADNPDTRIGETKENGKTVVKRVPMTGFEMSKNEKDYFKTKVNGKEHYIKMKDPLLMQAMSNLGVEQANVITQTLGKVTRTLSALVTTWNPEFMITNVSRDIQTAIYNVLSETQVADGKAKGTEKLVAKMILSPLPKSR